MRFVVKCSAPEFLFLVWHSTHRSSTSQNDTARSAETQNPLMVCWVSLPEQS